MRDLAVILLSLIAIAGWVIAQGFWQVLFAVVFPPYSIYLVIEKLMTSQGWV